MKKITILFLLLNFTQIFSQDQLVVGLPDYRLLYRNYNNKVQLAFTDSGVENLDVQCENCDTIYRSENSTSEYIIVPGNEREVKLTVTNKKNKNASTNNVITFRVTNLPVPSVYFGPISSESKFGIVFSKLFVKYPPEVFLAVAFDIKNWKITIDDKIFEGKRSVLSEEVINYLKNIEKETTFTIDVTYRGMGIERITSGQFTLYEKSRQTIETKSTTYYNCD